MVLIQIMAFSWGLQRASSVPLPQAGGVVEAHFSFWKILLVNIESLESKVFWVFILFFIIIIFFIIVQV